MRSNKKNKAVGDQWVLVGRLDLRKAFARNPLDSIHQEIRRLAPAVTHVSDVGVSAKTNKYLETRLRKFVKKTSSYLSRQKVDTTVAINMLNYSPCDVPADAVENLQDFHVYVRSNLCSIP